MLMPLAMTSDKDRGANREAGFFADPHALSKRRPAPEHHSGLSKSPNCIKAVEQDFHYHDSLSGK